MTKQELLAAVTALASRGEVTRQEVVEAYQQGAGEATWVWHGIHFTTARVLYALGTLVVLAGLIFLVHQSWDSFGAVAQIAITLGVSLVLYVAAVLVQADERWRDVSVIFFVMAAVMMPIGIYVTLRHVSASSDVWMGQLLMAGLPALVFAVTYRLFRHPTQFLLAGLFAAWTVYALVGLLLDRWSVGGTFERDIWAYLTLVVGVSYSLIGYALRETANRKLVGVYYLLGSAMALGAGFSLTQFYEWWVFVYFLLILAALYLGTLLRSRSFLLFGALALIAHLTRISFEYFADSFGWPLALIVAGFIIIGVGWGTVALHTRFISKVE